MRYLRPAIIALLALVTVLLVSGRYPITANSLGPTPTYGLTEPLKIGVLFPFTGDLSEFGPAFLNGANLAKKHINEAGGVNGQPIQIITADSGTSSSQAVSEATRLIDDEGVSAIVGAASSWVTLPVAQSVTIPSQVVLISPSSTSPAITTVDDNDYLFRTVPSDAFQSRALGQLAWEQGYQTACAMYINNDYGQGLSDEFTQSFEALGGQVLATVPHEDAQSTYLPQLTSCTFDNPDVVAVLSYTSNPEVLLIEAIDNALASSFLFSDGLKSQDMIDAVEAAVGSGSLDGTLGTAPGSTTSKVFDSQYESEYGEPPPLSFIGEAYSAVALLALAAEKAGSADSTAIRDALRQMANPPGKAVSAGSVGIAQALRSIRDGKDINYLGHTGVVDLDFDLNGDVTTAAIEVWTIQGSQIVTVRVDYLGPTPAPCAEQWPVTTITTIGKGQGPSINSKVSHDITGHIVEGASAYGPTAHSIEICEGTAVTAAVIDTTGTPTNTVLQGPMACDPSGCTVSALTERAKYGSVSSDGKDTDRITLIPVP